MREQISKRFLDFCVCIYRQEKILCKSFSGKHVYQQLFRAGTSAAANYEEATSAESKKDFVHKMQVVLKEIREAHFWIRFAIKAKMLPAENADTKYLFSESKELLNIIGKAVSTTKKNMS
ncbi:MAG: four helix bundle protein [Chitinophagales bacterium]